ncbi:hypothetical protein QUF90_26220 [Desulfococcaceae bacterium HSG9]|nr:hypothetical protein [Desulfococcaceae bacterium HSG9]
METVAVYWEPTIKTYGFNEITDMSLVRMASDNLEKIGSLIDELDSVKNQFALLWNQNDSQHDIKSICLGVSGQNRRHAVALLKQKCLSKNIDFIDEIYPAGIVYFHGPHYGDRYGIAETVFKTLNGKVKIIAAGFSGAAVYLVFPGGDVKTAIALLSQTFETPDSEH